MTTSYEIVPATKAHAEELARTMREADKAEVWAASHRTPMQALEVSLLVSRDTARSGLADGRVVCMFGVGFAGTIITPKYSPWLLGAEELPQHARKFLRLNREYVAEIREKYNPLENFVDARNEVSIRWLRWLGFDIKEAVPFGPDQLLFHPFEMRKALACAA